MEGIPSTFAACTRASAGRRIRRQTLDDSLGSIVHIPDPRTRALALKLKGSCLEVLGDYPGALRSYDSALALDPKIGVKRRADRMRKEL